jgi:hypothetical protein
VDLTLGDRRRHPGGYHLGLRKSHGSMPGEYSPRTGLRGACGAK